MKTPALVLCFVLLTLNLPTDTDADSIWDTSTTTPFPTPALYTNCGGYFTESCGMFSSPQYPYNYPSNCRCSWVISTAPATYVVIYFSSVSLESNPTCVWDFVSIHDGPPGSNMIAKICEPRSYTFYATSNVMTIVFNSDISVEYKGFHAIYYTQAFYDPATTAAPSNTVWPTTTPSNTVWPTTIWRTTMQNQRCGGRLTRKPGSITSPFYPSNYPPNTLCTWEIVTEPIPNAYLIISIHVESLESNPTCMYDYLEILDGYQGSPVLGRICEPGEYFFLSLVSNIMTVVFRSDGSIEGSGFEAHYEASYYATPPASTTSAPDAKGFRIE